jgi:hypothetical protein
MTHPTNCPTCDNPGMPTITRRSQRGDAPAITVSDNAACSVLELLELCDLFLRTATPAVRAELSGFLDHQPTGLDANLLIDMLGFNALYLQGVMALADAHRADATGGRNPGAGRPA